VRSHGNIDGYSRLGAFITLVYCIHAHSRQAQLETNVMSTAVVQTSISTRTVFCSPCYGTFITSSRRSMRCYAPPLPWRQLTNQHRGAQATLHTNSVNFYWLRHPCKTRVFNVADKLVGRVMVRWKRIVVKSLMPTFYKHLRLICVAIYAAVWRAVIHELPQLHR
jgi:hypothetical protein